VKFFCEQCKAKYQIPDEKVAGKTVRMKCRKCSFLIEVRPHHVSASAPPPAPAPHDLGLGQDEDDDIDEKTSIAAPHENPLAQAFRRANTAPSPVAAPAPAPAVGTWYVAIDGTPVGPITEAEFKERVDAGQVDPESLAWREGLEEWQPARNFAELAGFFAKPKPAPAPAPAATPRAPTRPAAARTASTPAPTRNVVPTGPTKSNVIPMKRDPFAPAASLGGIDGSAAGARGGAAAAFAEPVPATAEPDLASDPFAVLGRQDRHDSPPPASGDRGADPFGAGFGKSADPFGFGKPADPFAAPAAVAQAPAAAPPADPFAAVPAPAAAPADAFAATPSVLPPAPAKKSPLLGLVIGLLALAFAGAAGTVVYLLRKAPTIVEKVVEKEVIKEVRVPGEAAPATPAGVATADPAGGTKVASNAGGSHPSTAGATTATAAPAVNNDLKSLLGGGSGPSGPTSSGTSSGGSAGGGGLTQSDISNVVSSRSVAIKRTCYERGNSTANSVNVTAKITVAPSGNVQNVSASGNDSAIAKCIEGQIRTWKFPAPGSTTEVTVPFKFVRQ
jgi:predicted Zn finger-like uncharacterized protein